MPTFETFVQCVINGFVVGSGYTLVALGLTMIFGVLRIPNFGHGKLLMLSAFVTLFAGQLLKIGYLWALGLAGGYPVDFPAKVIADFAALPTSFTPRLGLPAERMPQGLESVIADKQTPATSISMGFPVAIGRSSDGGSAALTEAPT